MTVVPAKTFDEIISLANKSAISLVRFLFCDTSSIIRAKTTRVDRLKDRLESGIGIAKATFATNLLDQLQTDTGFSATGEVRLMSDPESWTVLPYSDRAAAMICDVIDLNRKPWPLCTRSLLKRQIEKAKQNGVSLQVAFEPEFMLGTMENEQFVPIDRGLFLSTDGMNRAAKFINRFVDCLERQNIEVEQYYPELGHGQHEVSIRHADALRACDRHIFYRETLRGVACEQNMEAYLAPKPLANQPGNGCHIHLSAWDIYGERNLFYAADGLSEFGRHFVAGLLEHLPGLVALTCASVNSYRRLQPKAWSSAYTCWGFDNREAAIRVPSTFWGQEMASCNIEIKCVDNSANPYLALAAIIACGMDGVKRQLALPPQVENDPSTLSPQEMIDKKVERLPASLHEALIELEQDPFLMDLLGPDLSKTYIVVKTSECGAFAGANAEFELAQHRSKF